MQTVSTTDGSLALVTLLLAGSLVGWLVNSASCRPILWHNGVWIVTLLVLSTNLVAYDQASAGAWLVLACGLGAFNIAGIVALSVNSESRQERWQWRSPGQRHIVSRQVLLVACVAYFACFGIYLETVITHYGLQVLLGDPGSLRTAAPDGETYLSRVPLLARFGLNLGPVLLMLFAVRESVRFPLRASLRVSMIVLISATLLAMLQRTNFFMAVLWYVVYIATRSRPAVTKRTSRARSGRRSLQAVAILVLGPLILFGAFEALGGVLGKTGQQALATDRVSPVLASTGLTDVYVYATSGIPAFLKLNDSNNAEWPPQFDGTTQVTGDYNPQTMGAATLGSLSKIIPGVRSWNLVAAFIDVGVLTNIFTWFELAYRDFRLAGVIGYGAIMGFSMIFLHRLRFQSARMLWIQAALISTVFLSTFTAKTSTTIFWTGILFVAIFAGRAGLDQGVEMDHASRGLLNRLPESILEKG